MDKTKGKILWIDSTIGASPASPYLKPYVRFLEYQGYDVLFADNDATGIALLREEDFPRGNIKL